MSNPLDEMTVKPVKKILRGTRGLLVDLIGNRSGNAAVEFAVIVPLMLAMFFGTVETSSGVAVDRKVTLVARTLSDLVSQSTSVSNTDLSNFLITAKAILTPYATTPLNATISELYVDPTSKTAKVIWTTGKTMWGTGDGMTSRKVGDTISIPSTLKIDGTYLIFSEVNYKYEPTVGYIMKAGITLDDSTYTRPRQSACVINPTPASGTLLPNCPTK
jgi:Flp pilus assembly protein TadG